MTEHGAALQTYNQELIKCLEEFKTKRKELLEVIKQEEEEKATLDRNMKALQEKIAHLNGNLQQHKQLCENYDKTIRETELGFKKIVESSQTLLKVAQHEANKFENTIAKHEEINGNYNTGDW
ncbi:unnamed protein product [Ceutorhynchus assimilis]|uniref:Uncharacterized protein n=1 Tax=Ceutorhynchus assimilis TaxID=467358 RepID=A0A9N9MXK4_9CUCU|nr:unnamed protein product [Ceutorhynchus assimilis]